MNSVLSAGYQHFGIYFVTSASRGFHIYHSYWTPVSGEILSTELDYLNPHDIYAVAIKKDNIIVGHVPRDQSKVCSYFIRRGGVIQFEVTSARRRQSNLPQGGLEIPGLLTFFGHIRDTSRLHRLLQDID